MKFRPGYRYKVAISSDSDGPMLFYDVTSLAAEKCKRICEYKYYEFDPGFPDMDTVGDRLRYHFKHLKQRISKL